ncbi:MAG: sulfurtransferase complex subunit TusB [Endozoicomonas sp.]
MKTLHTINKAGPPFDNCLKTVADGDSILLIEEGVYVLLSVQDQLKKIQSSCRIMAIDTDMNARGVNKPDYCLTINYAEFVDQSVRHERVLSWF